MHIPPLPSWMALMCMTVTAPAAFPADPAAPRRQLIRDPHFQAGFRILKTTPGKVVFAGEWRFRPNLPPAWRIAQWSSRFPIENAPAQELPGGIHRRKNRGKLIETAPPGNPRADLTLAVDGWAEYAGHARTRKQRWPHLLVSQRFANPPRLSEVEAARFHIAARLLYCRRDRNTAYDPRLHAAQFLVYLSIQNLNRNSSGYGDFLYFGIPLFDSRHPYPRPFYAPDAAGKFIFSPGGSAYADHPMSDGAWLTVDKDILPLIHRGLRMAWNRGFLLQSKNPADYRIAAINLGWEIPGAFQAAVQVRDLALTVALRAPDPPPGDPRP